MDSKLTRLVHDSASSVFCCPDCGLHLLLARKHELCPAKVARRIAEADEATRKHDATLARCVRAEAALACERGEAAPDGWVWEEGPCGQHYGVGEWRKISPATGVPNSIVRQNTGIAGPSARWCWHVHVPNSGGFAPTAIEAIEAAEERMRAR